MVSQQVASLGKLASVILERAAGSHPFLLAVAGAPGSGKSTLAEALSEELQQPSCVIPMDGFHLDNVTLHAEGLFSRKGAPETFDLEGFSRLATALRDGGAQTFPTFDRGADRVVPEGGIVPSGTRILIFEGNYLLLDEPGWRDLHHLWDASVWLDIPHRVLEERLMQRWRSHGLSDEEARARVWRNDLPNAVRVSDTRKPSSWVLNEDWVPS
jgi:fructokinase